MEEKKYIEINLAGKDDELWKSTQAKFMKYLNHILDFELDPVSHATVKENLGNFTHDALDYFKSKLNAPGINNLKVQAEIEESYNRIEYQKQQTRALELDNQKREFDLRMHRIKTVLSLFKALSHKSADGEQLLFIKNLDNFLGTIESMRGDRLD
jgi:hypothetical protein